MPMPSLAKTRGMADEIELAVNVTLFAWSGMIFSVPSPLTVMAESATVSLIESSTSPETLMMTLPDVGTVATFQFAPVQVACVVCPAVPTVISGAVLVPAGMIWIAEMQPRALLPFVPPLMESGPESPLMRSVFAP